MRLRLPFGRRRQREEDLEQEIQGHLEMAIRERVERGEDPAEAESAARRELGNVDLVKEVTRDVWGWRWLEHLGQDVRYGLRSMRRSPGFTAIAVVALALGIGANTAIFSVINAVLLRPLPYAEPDRLMVVLHNGRYPVSPPNFVDWREQNRSFDLMGAADYWTANLAGTDNPEHLYALKVTPEVLSMLGVQPMLGRLFLPEEEEPGKEGAVVLTHGLWQRRFGGDTNVLGRTVTLDGQAFTVVGVMPQGFRFAPFWATKAELFAPISYARQSTSRDGQHMRVFARLKRGVSLAQARADMAAITARLEKEFPGTNRDVVVLPLAERVVGDIRPALFVLLGAVGFVLLIACANVAHMLLARAAARQKEVAVRATLGAGRSRIIRQFLTESLLLASLGGGAGLALAVWGTRLLVALAPGRLPRVEGIGLDGRVLVYLAAVSLLTGVAFGLAPALQMSSAGLSDALKESSRGSTDGVRGRRLRGLLLSSEFALALMLLIGAGLMIRSFVGLQAVDPGFEPKNVLSMVVSVTGSAEAAPHRRAVFYPQLLEAVRQLPGVVAASGINHLPLAGDIWGWPFHVEGQAKSLPGQAPSAAYRIVMPGYFRAMGIPILRGRDVAESDTLNSPLVVVVNECLARKRWPGQDALGKRITLDDKDWITVVGVTKNAVRSDWAAAPDDEIYLPALQNSGFLDDPGPHISYITLVVRTSGDPAALAPAVRRLVRSFDRDLPVSEVQTMEEVVAESNSGPRLYLILLGAFAAVALVLAAVGIYGVISYSVSRRTHEIGIRMALGATRGEVVRLVVSQGMVQALAGAGVGLLGALGLTRLMSDLLYGVRPTDAVTFLAVPLVLGAVAAAASYIPARRVARIDPMAALRSE